MIMCVRLRLRQFSAFYAVYSAWIAALFALLLLLNSHAVQAHEIRPAVVTMDLQAENVQADARFTVHIDLNLEALLAGLTAVQGEQHSDTDADGQTDPLTLEYERLRALSPDVLEKHFREQQGILLKALRLKSGEHCVRLTLNEVVIPDVSVLPVARNSVITLTGQLPANDSTFTWLLAPSFGDVILRVNAGEQELHTAYLEAGGTSEVIAQPAL